MLLGRLAEGVDLSPEAFPYMNVRTATIAGVATASCGGSASPANSRTRSTSRPDTASTSGRRCSKPARDLGVAPFGVEAQRIMRLEKGHFIVGQDTDGLIQAYSAGLDWLVKLDKEDFVGKPELVWARNGRTTATGERLVLVGLQPVDPTLVPPERRARSSRAASIVGRHHLQPVLPHAGPVASASASWPNGCRPAGTVVTVRLPRTAPRRR